MPAVENSTRVLSLALIAAAAAIALAVFWQTPGHMWGDDFAGYLMQAKALLSATPGQELDLNARLMAASDWRTGPDAYPWGYPAILAVVILTLGQSLSTFKIVSIVAIGVVTLAAGLLAYTSRLSLVGAVCVAILVGMQPDLTSLGDVIGSDAVFLALTAVALLFAALALEGWPRRQSSAALRRWAMLGAAVVGCLSFFVRSNGAVTLLAIAASIVVSPVVAERRSLRSLLSAAVSAAAFALVCAALIGAYFALLPDGNIGLTRYLTLEPSSLLRRSSDAVIAFGGFFPMMALPDPVAHLAVAAIAMLVGVGAWRLGKIGFLLSLYSAGQLLLVILFPFSGGPRYYLPLVLSVAILCASGVEGLASRAARRVSSAGQLKIVSPLLVAALFIGAIAANFYRFDRQQDQNIDGPYSPAAAELFAYVRGQPRNIQPVGFFKPRAMRLLAGKESILVREIGSTQRVNSIAIDRQRTAVPFQLSERQVAALQDFRPAFRNEEFTLYVRKQPGRIVSLDP
jgi:hypothetical protein